MNMLLMVQAHIAVQELEIGFVTKRTIGHHCMSTGACIDRVDTVVLFFEHAFVEKEALLVESEAADAVFIETVGVGCDSDLVKAVWIEAGLKAVDGQIRD